MEKKEMKWNDHGTVFVCIYEHKSKSRNNDIFNKRTQQRE